MDDCMATIWVRIGTPGKNSIKIGGVYREHLILGENNTEMTRQEHKLRQEQRWRMFLKKWKSASRKQNCVVVGDFNLDHLKWDSPDIHQEIMILDTQQIIESEGFVQLVDNITRSQSNQTDSLIDHVWVNCGDRISWSHK